MNSIISSRRRRFAPATIAVLFLATIQQPVSRAQDTPGAQSGEDLQLEQVTVTARKREESLQQVPITVNAVTSQDLTRLGVTSMTQLTQEVPGIYFSSFGGGQPLVAIRGNANRIQGTPGVGFFTDGVVTTNSSQFTHGPVDAARVEVLQGPQGTVYGKNTIAGAVNVITNDPTASYEGLLTGGYGGSSTSGDSLWEAQGLLSGPVTDKLEGRVVFKHDQRAGYLYDPVSGTRLGNSKDDYARAKLKWQPAEGTTVKLTAEYAYENVPRYEGFQPYPGGVHPFIGSTPIDIYYPGVSGPFYEIRANPTEQLFSKTTQSQAYLEIAHETSIGTITSLTSVATAHFTQYQDADSTQYQIVDIRLLRNNTAASQELRLNGSANGWTWLGGLYYLYDFTQELQDQIFFPLSRFYQGKLADQPNFYKQTTDDYAVFGQVGYSITPKLQATLGGRWSRETKSSPMIASAYSTTGAVTVVRAQRSASWNSSTYLASLNYNWRDDLMSYISYSTGFKAGGFQQAANANVANTYYNPEKVGQAEVGLKSDLLRHRVRLNLAGYYLKYADLQVNNLRFFGTTPIQLVSNAAGAKVLGMDLDLKMLVNRYLTASVSDTYLGTAKITGFSSLGGFPSIEGFRIPRSPTNSLAAGLDFQAPLPDQFLLNLGAQYSYRTRFVNELDATKRSDGTYATVPLPAYGLLNLNGGVSRGPWDVGFYVRNVTNKAYWTGGSSGGGGNLLPLLTFGEPRTWEARATYHFD